MAEKYKRPSQRVCCARSNCGDRLGRSLTSAILMMR
jgi:hypothetical protein